MRDRDAVLGRIRLRHLQAFLAVVRGGTLRAAAGMLSVSQPAVTKTLNELEEILGARLFERGRRGARLTPEAEVFLRHAQASMAALEHAVDEVIGGHDEAPLRLGVLPTVAPALPPVLVAFRSEWPRVPLRAVTGRNRELLGLLRQRELDAVVGRLAEPDEMEGLTFELLHAQPLAIVARPGHALLQRRGCALSEIGRRPLVLPPAGTVIRHAADSFLAAHGIVPQLGITETLSTSLARALVLASDALWFTPPTGAEPDLAGGALARLPVDTTGTEEPVGLLLPADALPSPALRALLTALRAAATALRGDATAPSAGRAAARRRRRTA